MQNKPESDSPSGYSRAPLPQIDNCPPHHWRLGLTKHSHVPEQGLTNIGQTEGVCRKCGAIKEWESPTPDNVHGMDAHILAEMAGEGLPEEDLGYGDDE